MIIIKDRVRLGLFVATWIATSGVVWAGGDVVERPPAPTHVRAERQDFQAARITWDRMDNNMKYCLYASFDRKPPDFHKENDTKPFSDTFAIWDAPRNGLRKFIFYVTSVDPKGHESQPSKRVHVDLGPLP